MLPSYKQTVKPVCLRISGYSATKIRSKRSIRLTFVAEYPETADPVGVLAVGNPARIVRPLGDSLAYRPERNRPCKCGL
jgi:hypothetical protein